MGVKKRIVPPLEIITPGVELDEKFKPMKARDLRPLRKFLAWYSCVAIIILGLIFGLVYHESLLRSPLVRYVGAACSFAFYLVLIALGALVWLVLGNSTMVRFAWKALPWDIPAFRSMLGLFPFVLLPAYFCYRFIKGPDDKLPVTEKELSIKTSIAMGITVFFIIYFDYLGIFILFLGRFIKALF